MLMLNTSPKPNFYDQYGCDHSSRFERAEKNQLTFYLNVFHQEYFIELNIKSNNVPVILQKLKEDSFEIELILLGYTPTPSLDYDPDALLQQVICEILNQKEEGQKLDMSQEIIITYYQDEL